MKNNLDEKLINEIISSSTFDYLQKLLESDNIIAVSHVHSKNLNSIFENGFYCNSKGVSKGYGVSLSDFQEQLVNQNNFAKENGELSYLEMLKRGNYSFDINGICSMARDNNLSEYKILSTLKLFNSSVDLENSMYYNISDINTLLEKIIAASSKKSEGGNPIDGTLIFKFPSNLKSSIVDINSGILMRTPNGNLCVKPKYIDGYLYVTNNLIGDFIPNSNLNKTKK